MAVASPRWYERALRWLLRLYGYRSRYTETAVGRLHHLERPGDPRHEPLVLLHGVSAAGVTWSPLLRRLAWYPGPVLAPDFPGHGFSAIPARLDIDTVFHGTAELLDLHLSGPACLLGNSLGGAMALRYAHERPDSVARLALLSPAGAPLTEAERDEVLACFRVETFAQARAFTRRVYHRVPWYAAFVARELRRQLRRPWIRELFETLREVDEARPDQLAALRVPILLAWGRSDHLLPRSALAFFRAHLPAHATVLEPEGFSHNPYLERPREVAGLLRDFVAQPLALPPL